MYSLHTQAPNISLLFFENPINLHVFLYIEKIIMHCTAKLISIKEAVMEV